MRTDDADAAMTDDTRPDLSVIMAVRDVEDWISEAVWSILNQSLQSLELIIVDDRSADGTAAIVTEFSHSDARVRFLPNPGTGGADARNFGVSIASGEFIAFADGDDVVPSRAYQTMIEQARESGSEMVVGNHLVLEPQRTLTRNQSLPIFGSKSVGISLRDEPRFLRDRVCWNRIVRRSSWEALGIRFADARRSNDILAMVHCYCAMPFDVVPEPVYAYRRRVGASSMTASKLRPESLADHFAQEFACMRAVAELGEPHVLEVYYHGILEHDVWAHGRSLFTTAAAEDAAFAPARELIRELLLQAPHGVIDRLGAVKATTYSYIRDGNWAMAGVVAAVGHPEELREVLAGVGAEEAFRQIGQIRRPEIATSVVRDAILSLIEEARLPGLTDEELARAQRNSRSAKKHGATSGLNRDERRLLAVLDRDPEGMKARLLREYRRRRRLHNRAIRFARRTGGRALRKLGVRR